MLARRRSFYGCIALCMLLLCRSTMSLAQADTRSIVYVPIIRVATPVFAEQVSTYNLGQERLFIGEVVNTLDIPIYKVKVTVQFFDVTTQRLISITDSPYLARTLPNGRNPFKTVDGDTGFDTIENIRVQVTYETTTSLEFGSLQVVSTPDLPNTPLASIRGTVLNPENTTLYYPSVVMSAYDKDGNLVGTDYNYLGGPLAAKAQTSYELNNFRYSVIARLLIQGEGYRKP